MLRVYNVLDIRTGKVFDTQRFLAMMSDQEKHELRANQLGEDRILNYACPVCDQNVYLSGAGPSRKKVYHFKHFPQHGDCPLKERHDLSKDDIKRIMYNGAKESDQHKKIKNWIGNFLKGLEPQGDFARVRIEERIKSAEGKKHWRQPDVSCIYKDRRLVFELQLNRTFVEVIRGREDFYARENTFICWLFDGFNPHDTDFGERDIFWLNKSNAFAITEETMRLSEREKDFLVECHYVDPVIEGNIVKDVWISRIVSFSQLMLTEGYYKPFYFDSDAAKQKIARQLLTADFTNYMWGGIRKNLDNRERRERDSSFLKKFAFALKTQGLPDEASSGFVSILDALYFLKTEKVENLNRKFTNIKQFTNQIIYLYPEYGLIYCKAIKKYHPNFKREQLGDKLKKKVEDFWRKLQEEKREGKPDGQNNDYDSILQLLFPELI